MKFMLHFQVVTFARSYVTSLVIWDANEAVFVQLLILFKLFGDADNYS